VLNDNEASADRVESVRPLLLKVPEACKVLGCSRSQLYLLLKHGEITGIMIGPGQRRISYAECEAYVTRKTAEARHPQQGAA
jgi:excisionase family DNA binding protein